MCMFVKIYFVKIFLLRDIFKPGVFRSLMGRPCMSYHLMVSWLSFVMILMPVSSPNEHIVFSAEVAQPSRLLNSGALYHPLRFVA